MYHGTKAFVPTVTAAGASANIPGFTPELAAEAI
jgi:hypothetical protein